MEEYLILRKIRKKIEYINRLIDVFEDENDGLLYEEMSESEQEKFDNFYEFLNDLLLEKEKRLNKIANIMIKEKK